MALKEAAQRAASGSERMRSPGEASAGFRPVEAEEEKITLLIQALQKEMPQYAQYHIPLGRQRKWEMLRALFNVRPPYPASEEFLRLQDEVLQELIAQKGVTDIENLQPTGSDHRLFLWQGDITTLKVDAAVNAANSQMLGCWRMGHSCVDNFFHSFAGVEMRLECHRQMEEKRRLYGDGYEQPTAVPMITPGYNLPAGHVIHVVGPIVEGELTEKHENELAACYRASLSLAEKHHCQSIAFCCISTGVFMFPNERAAEIAIRTVRKWLDEHHREMKVVFNTFKDMDREIYQRFLC